MTGQPSPSVCRATGATVPAESSSGYGLAQYEAVYLQEFADGFNAEQVIGAWVHRAATFYARRPDAGRSACRGAACGYDGQDSRPAHILTVATTATRRVKQDSGGVMRQWNSPLLRCQIAEKGRNASQSTIAYHIRVRFIRRDS